MMDADQPLYKYDDFGQMAYAPGQICNLICVRSPNYGCINELGK